MIDLAFRAMKFAMDKHKDQRRKYTNNPYTDHLAEVAGIVSAVLLHEVAIACAWLHDVVEDLGVTEKELRSEFGAAVARGVMALSDLEEGNRAERKRLSRERLSQAESWVQTIKVADLISNTSSIVEHDPKFAVTYLEEKRLLLDVLTEADPRLLAIAREQVGDKP
ncbi:GTP pyrophosphokinase rsh [Cedecea lapagei]|uniref:GTP pyrophosphokinase rsh n=1 Tax=Cedecea lapagei TaxID=158823 RepID=A0A3S4MF82_9ENTR|nr:HD domain-containing protein [Cedecea lapagei]VEB97341.1 GTP pyrophosphokinase rsh [Cedecea lapagei]